MPFVRSAISARFGHHGHDGDASVRHFLQYLRLQMTSPAPFQLLFSALCLHPKRTVRLALSLLLFEPATGSCDASHGHMAIVGSYQARYTVYSSTAQGSLPDQSWDEQQAMIITIRPHQRSFCKASLCSAQPNGCRFSAASRHLSCYSLPSSAVQGS